MDQLRGTPRKLLLLGIDVAHSCQILELNIGVPEVRTMTECTSGEQNSITLF